MPSVAGDFTVASLTGDTSTDGLSISIAATSSPGTTLETATSDAGYWSYIKVWLVNLDTVAHTVVVEWGGTAAKDAIPIELGPGLGPVSVFEDFRLLRGGQVVRAYCDNADVVTAFGEVHTYRSEL